MRLASLHAQKLADAMSAYGYQLGQEAENITRHDLLMIANALQTNVNVLLEMAESLPEDTIS